MRGHMDRQITPPKRVTSPTWGPPPPCKQALSLITYKCDLPLPFPPVLSTNSAVTPVWLQHYHGQNEP